MHSFLPRAARVIMTAAAAGILMLSSSAAAGGTGDYGFRRAPTVIIDAGHGGADGGAVSPSGTIESSVNLDIARRLELILAFFGTDVVMTRTEETIQYSDQADTIHKKKIDDIRRRIALVNDTPNAVLISIHQNNFPSGGPFGAQVLYAPTDGSKPLAEYLQQLLISSLNPKNRRTASEIPDSIMLLNRIKCPAVLIECGFLSNAEEERLLKTDAYKLKLAAVISAGYLYNKAALTDPGGGGTETYEGENSVLLHSLRQ